MYDKFAPLYDHFVDWKSRLAFEMPFLLRQLTRLGPDPAQIRVMDTACGTGRHAIALSQAGYQVSGSDLYPDMVSMASAHAEADMQKINFKTAGFGNISNAFGAPGGFDAVLCLGNSLPHVDSALALHVALADFHNLLSSGGAVLLQMRNFDKVVRSESRWMDPQDVSENGHEWLFFRFYDFLPNGLIRFNVISLQHESADPWKMDLSSTTLFPIGSELLREAISAAGFREIEYFGSMRGEPFNTDESSDLVVFARKV